MLNAAYTVGRVFVPIIFIVSGVQKAMNVAGTAKMLADTNIPVPEAIVPYLQGIPKYEALTYLTAAAEIICGLMIMAGIAARWGALVLFVFTAAATFYFHNFWQMTGEAAAQNQVHALKNLSIMGALLLIVSGGPIGRATYGRSEQ
ncbi:MAG: DoxX family protein [Pseudomonadota bacterium]